MHKNAPTSYVFKNMWNLIFDSQKQFLQIKLLFLPPEENNRIWAPPCKSKNLETSTENVFYIEYSYFVVRLKKNLHIFYVVKKTSVFGQTIPYLAPRL